jgi:feruloyl esterase
VDWLAVITDWVEHGAAPERVIASKSAHGKIEMSRPLFSYPTTVVYKGSGDPASADSFVAKPAPETAP